MAIRLTQGVATTHTTNVWPLIDACEKLAVFVFLRGTGLGAADDPLVLTTSTNHFSITRSAANLRCLMRNVAGGSHTHLVPYTDGAWFPLLLYYDGAAYSVYNGQTLVGSVARSGPVTAAVNSVLRLQPPASAGGSADFVNLALWARPAGDATPFPTAAQLLPLAAGADPESLAIKPDAWYSGSASVGRGLRTQVNNGMDFTSGTGASITAALPPAVADPGPWTLPPLHGAARTNDIAMVGMSFRDYFGNVGNPWGYVRNFNRTIAWDQGRFDAMDFVMEQIYGLGFRETWFWNMFGQHDWTHPGCNGYGVMPWYFGAETKSPGWDASWADFRDRWRARGMRLGFWLGGVAVPNLGGAAVPNIQPITSAADIPYVIETLAALRQTEGFDAVGLDYSAVIRGNVGRGRLGEDLLSALFDAIAADARLDGLYVCGEGLIEPGRSFRRAPWMELVKFRGNAQGNPDIDALADAASLGYDDIHPGRELLLFTLAGATLQSPDELIEIPLRGAAKGYSRSVVDLTMLRVGNYVRYGTAITNAHRPVGTLRSARLGADGVSLELRYNAPIDDLMQTIAWGATPAINPASAPKVYRAWGDSVSVASAEGPEAMPDGSLRVLATLAAPVEPGDRLYGQTGYLTGDNTTTSGGALGVAIARQAADASPRGRGRGRGRRAAQLMTEFAR